MNAIVIGWHTTTSYIPPSDIDIAFRTDLRESLNILADLWLVRGAGVIEATVEELVRDQCTEASNARLEDAESVRENLAFLLNYYLIFNVTRWRHIHGGAVSELKKLPIRQI